MGKIASTLLTFLFSIPITAVGLMAIFGVPQLAPLNATPSDEIVIRDPYDQDPWNEQSGNAPQLGESQEFPQFQMQQDPGSQPSQTNEAPAWGQQGSNSSRNQSQPVHNPFNHLNAGHSFSNQPLQQPSTNHAINNQSNGIVSSSGNQPSQPGESAFGSHISVNNHPNTTETSAQMLTWVEASARLAELGIKYHLERGNREGTFLFVCLYRSESNPHVMHRFEAEENNPIVAVNKTIAQVENWLQEQYRISNLATASRY